MPSLRGPCLSILKSPLYMFTALRREIGGLIFYHRNYIRNEQLKKENDALKNDNISLRDISAENQRLKNALSFKEKSSYKLIAARVIARSPDNWTAAVIIDKGSFHGIKRGCVALTHLGLIGRVIEAEKNVSKIMLINDPNFGVSCIAQRSRQEGLVSGTLGGSLMMKYLPPDADIQVSDLVVTSGLTGIFPKGLLVGTVMGIGEEFSGLSRYCIIKPAVNLSQLEEVLIIIP